MMDDLADWEKERKRLNSFHLYVLILPLCFLFYLYKLIHTIVLIGHYLGQFLKNVITSGISQVR
jgi:hypothetical protein